MAARSTIVVFLLLSACGEDPGGGPLGPEGVRSGSRLRARFLDDGEGARQFLGFHDGERDEDCDFAWNEAVQTTHCLPGWQYYSGRYFRDSACSEEILPRLDGTEYLSYPSNASCNNQWATSGGPLPEQLWTYGQEVSVETVYGRSETGCGEIVGDLNGPWHERVEVSLDTFVTGEVIDSGDGRLRGRAIEGEDGSRQAVAIYDRDLDTVCAIPGQEEAASPCLPAAIGIWGTSLFADEACSKEFFPVSSVCQDAAPPYEVKVAGDGSTTLFHRGDSVAVAEAYRMEGDSCSFTNYPMLDGFLVGAQLGIEELALAERRPAADTGRLQPYDWMFDGLSTRVADVVLFHDRLLDVDCFAQTADDGVKRCLPSAIIGRYFLDADCFSSSALLARTATAIEPAYGSQPISADEGDLPEEWQAYRVGAELPTGTPVYRFFGDLELICTQVADGAHYHEVGERLPPSDFVELREVTE